MSNDGGSVYGPNEPTSYGLQPPQGVPGQGAQSGGNPYAQQPAAPTAPPSPYAQPTQVVPQQAAESARADRSGQGAQAARPARSVHPAHPAQPAQSAQADPGAGRLVGGRYRLLSKLGHGGMGTVWRAKDETVDREVAVKEPRVPDHLPERERANAFERMRREARAAARLDHPAVVNVHDVVVEDGQPWIVMEFVQGRSLGDALQEGTLDAREAARVGLEVLGALEAAHAAGVLHRDVKPDNVMLGRHGRVVLTDFGIAQIEGETNLTDTGGFVGSPEFIAPERVLGQRPGPASDLWSLGVVLYAATEGVSPFRRSNPPATLQSVLNATPAPPASANAPLAEVINGLLAKDPNQRPNAAQVRTLLEQAARPPAPAPTQVMRAGGGPDGGKGVRIGRKGLIGVGVVVVAAMVAGVLVAVNPFEDEAGADWKAHEEKPLGATVSAPAGYERWVPEDSTSGEHWVRFTDPSFAVSIQLSLDKKADDTDGKIAGSAAAEAYDDAEGMEKADTDHNWMDTETDHPKARTEETSYKGHKSAQNTVTYVDDETNSDQPRPREAKIFYYRTSSGDMYKLWIDYPGKGDFTERGREVARTAIDKLAIDKL